MPEHEKRKAQLARLLATVSVLGLSVGMFRPAQAEDLTPSQQDKWMPTATSGGASTPQDVASPKLDTFSGGGPGDQFGSGGGAGKINTVPGTADYMKYDANQGKFKGEDVGPPAAQNKVVQPDAIYMKDTAPTLTVPGAGPTQPK